MPKYEDTDIVRWYKEAQHQEKIQSGLLNVMSYNTWGLPIELKGHDHFRRFKSMADSLLLTNSDIIALQETFHPVLRDHLMKMLSKDYYTFSDYRCNRSILPYVEMDCYGGLMTLSSLPVTSEIFYPYPVNETSSIIEKTGGKGFLITQISHGRKCINIINTHLYAGDYPKAENIRMEQIKYMHKVIQHIPDFYRNETILLGDFNVHHPDVECSVVYDYIVSDMGFDDSKKSINDNDFTCDHKTNKYVAASEKRTKLDYVFLKSDLNDGKIDILNQFRAMDNKKLPMSDHFGWQVQIRLL
ncbi:MAG: endonuclease/exonuclease/phosphatase family protein [Saprospiraceae bacterium]|nr:endonuclease/exonuclease/phosphatase family protein [Saprospiraceae bacterium]